MKIFTDVQTVRTQIDGFRGLPGRDGRDGKDGRDGADGAPGKDGYTPQKGVDYFDGAPGKDGQDGAPGERGADGVSPIVTLAREADGVSIAVTDAVGTKTEKVYDGKDGSGSGTGSTSSDVYEDIGVYDIAETVSEFDQLLGKDYKCVYIFLLQEASETVAEGKVYFGAGKTGNHVASSVVNKIRHNEELTSTYKNAWAIFKNEGAFVSADTALTDKIASATARPVGRKIFANTGESTSKHYVGNFSRVIITNIALHPGTKIILKGVPA